MEGVLGHVYVESLPNSRLHRPPVENFRRQHLLSLLVDQARTHHHCLQLLLTRHPLLRPVDVDGSVEDVLEKLGVLMGEHCWHVVEREEVEGLTEE